jgi:diguanylate cyclase (GGDEF)-like protein/PAS domain S-box-containing protein
MHGRHADTPRAREGMPPARVLAMFFVAGSAIGFAALAFLPLPSTLSVTGNAIALGAGLVIGLVLFFAAARLPEWSIHAALACGTVVVSLGVYFGGRFETNNEMFYLWVAFYAFYFLTLRQALAHVAFVAAAYALAIGLTQEAGPAVTRWVITTGSLVVMGLLVARLVRQLRARMREAAERTESLREAEERFRRAFDDAAIGMALVSLEGRWLRVNHALAEITGYERTRLDGMSFAEITHPDDLEADLEALEQMIKGGRANFQTEKRYVHAQGHIVWVQLNVTVVRDRRGRPLHLISQMQDVTERKQAEAQLAHQALHDPLTGLANRLVLRDRLQVALNRLPHQRAAVAVLLVDLDRFKLVNDSLGHDAGDRVLVEAAARIGEQLRPTDTLARLGADEFAILCDDVSDEQAATVVADRVSEALSQPIALGGREVFLTSSVGIRVTRDADADPDDVLREADAAMYRAKERGRSRHAIFAGGMHGGGVQRLDTETALRHAVERHELALHYQPEVSLSSGRVVGVEALVRWRHPDRGLLAPADFIPLAEETGLIAAIGGWVLVEACAQAGRWQHGRPDRDAIRMAVNLSARQLADPSLFERVAGALEHAGLEPEMLCLEITESTVTEDPDAALSTLRQLTGLGVQLAIDDFGVGFSSLKQIRNLPPVDAIKVDRSFTAGLGRNREDSAIVASVVSLAHALGVTAIAEGVETAAHAAALRELGCDLAQGFYFARPAPPESVSKLLTAASLGELRV